MKFSALLAPLLGAALLSLVLANTVLPSRQVTAERRYHTFEIRLGSTVAGTAQLFYNAGRNYNETDSARAPVPAGAPTLLRFRLDAESIRTLRFDPLDADGTLTLADALIRRPDGSVLKRFAPEAFVPRNQIASTRIDGDTLTLRPQPGANDPFLEVLLDTGSLNLPARERPDLWPYVRRALPVFALLAPLLLLGVTLARRGQTALSARLAALAAWGRRHPTRALAAAAALAVVASSYPVVFTGASYVSPNYGTLLLYDRYPTLPGYHDAKPVDVRGADVGAIMWQHVPMAFVQARSWFRDFEVPLWNRYNSGGNALLGQGQYMVGDPLHTIVLLGGGSAASWDLKYLAAKWLLGLACGLLVWHTARHLPAALLVAALSVFSGFFAFRANHPAFFSFCYGPWVLYAWCRVASATSRRGLFGSLLGLVAACWFLLTSGTVKEAYVSLLVLNFSGLVLTLCAPLSWAERGRRIAGAVAAGVVFLLLAAPVWVTLLDTIASSYSSYNQAFAYQLQPALLLGLFDEILLRPFWSGELVFNPSANFGVLLGVLALLVNLRPLLRTPAALGFALAALLPLAFVFGFVPPQWIASWPFFGNIHHIDNSFGIPLIHLLTILAGFGLASAATRLRGPEGRGDLLLGGVMLLGLVALYVGYTQAVHRSTYTYLHWGETVPRSAFVWGCFASLLLGAVTTALVARHGLVRGRLGLAGGCVLAAALLVLLWRHGMQAGSAHPAYTLNAAPRVQLDAPSPALQAVQADARGAPFRVAGLRNNFFPGWSATYGLEGIGGPDALMNAHIRALQEAFGVERVWDWRFVVTPENLATARPFLDLLNVRYLLADSSDRPGLSPRLTLVSPADLDVWRNETAWPRAYFTNRVATYQNAADFAALVRASDQRPLAAVQSSDRDLPALPRGDLAGRTIVPATAYRLTNNTTSFTVNATAAGVIVLGEAWVARDFTATVNGQPATLFRINHAFKGLAVPQAGTYQVTVRYRPHHFALSLGLAGVGLAAVGGTGWWVYRRYPAASRS